MIIKKLAHHCNSHFGYGNCLREDISTMIPVKMTQINYNEKNDLDKLVSQYYKDSLFDKFHNINLLKSDFIKQITGIDKKEFL